MSDIRETLDDHERRIAAIERKLGFTTPRLRTEPQRKAIINLCRQLQTVPTPRLDSLTVEEADHEIKELIKAKELHR